MLIVLAKMASSYHFWTILTFIISIQTSFNLTTSAYASRITSQTILHNWTTRTLRILNIKPSVAFITFIFTITNLTLSYKLRTMKTFTLLWIKIRNTLNTFILTSTTNTLSHCGTCYASIVERIVFLLNASFTYILDETYFTTLH